MCTNAYVSNMRLLVILGSHKVLKKKESIKIISIGIYKVQVSPYDYIWGCFIIHTHAQLMRAPLFKTNGYAQSSSFPVSPF